MFIDRKQLAEIIAQEVRNRLTELAEAESEGGDGSGKRKRPKKPSTADAEDSPSPRGEPPPGPGAERPEDGSEPDERLERLCYAVLKHENVFVYFDESEGIATATSVPRYIRRIWIPRFYHGERWQTC